MAPETSLEAATETAVWTDFLQNAAAFDARLLIELQGAFAALHALVSAQIDRLAELVVRDGGSGSLAALTALYQDHHPALIEDPLSVYRRQQPLQRALAALDEHDRSIERLVRALPDGLTYTGRQWVNVIGRGRLGWMRRARLAMRRSVTVRAVPTVLLGAYEHRAARRPIDGRLLAALGETTLDVFTPWRIARGAWLATIAGRTAGPLEADLARLRAAIARDGRAVRAALAEMEAWTTRRSAVVARSLQRREANASSRLSRLITRDDRYREFLGRQCRAVDGTLGADARLASADAEMAGAAADAYLSIEREQGLLIGELDTVVEWLERWQPGDTSPFPQARTDVVPAATRLRALAQSLHAVAGALPQAIEVSANLVSRPRRRRSWTNQALRDVARQSLDVAALPAISAGMQVLERQQRDVVLMIERAREVVLFARESAGEGVQIEARIEQEGIGNARALLQFQRQQVRGVPPDVERAFVAGLVDTFERTYRAIEEGQFGLLRAAARDGLPRTARALWNRSGEEARRWIAALGGAARRLYRATLVRIGWIPAPPVPDIHVVTRDYLTRMLGAEARFDRLPLIHQRLFRVAPVEDPRFLIGRQEELAALADARALWEHGRAAAVVVVGARGSGKTSLINCAAQRALAGVDAVRSEFVERLTTRDDLYRFLSELLGVGPDEVEGELTAARRVIILEELERTFLRTPNGYGAIRALLGLISRTSTQNLWILSVNHSCFRLLNAALRLEPHFSHQINAMAVEQVHLREAIMMRHALSGLRLRFAEPVERDSWIRRAMRATGGPADPETAFFDALYRESGGVFRSAFALWQRYIDRAEGGVLYMKHPSRPAYEGIVGSLNVLDLFTLAALLQHGSLTPREHAVVFQIDDTRSRAWLDNLLARELIEPDPGRYGFRVVPDAAQVVRQALYRRNLG